MCFQRILGTFLATCHPVKLFDLIKVKDMTFEIFATNRSGIAISLPKSHHIIYGRSLRLASSSRYVTIKEWECWGGPVVRSRIEFWTRGAWPRKTCFQHWLLSVKMATPGSERQGVKGVQQWWYHLSGTMEVWEKGENCENRLLWNTDIKHTQWFVITFSWKPSIELQWYGMVSLWASTKATPNLSKQPIHYYPCLVISWFAKFWQVLSLEELLLPNDSFQQMHSKFLTEYSARRGLRWLLSLSKSK